MVIYWFGFDARIVTESAKESTGTDLLIKSELPNDFISIMD